VLLEKVLEVDHLGQLDGRTYNVRSVREAFGTQVKLIPVSKHKGYRVRVQSCGGSSAMFGSLFVSSDANMYRLTKRGLLDK
jgi:hypothetical protein